MGQVSTFKIRLCLMVLHFLYFPFDFLFFWVEFLWKFPPCFYLLRINWRDVFILLAPGPHIKKKWPASGDLADKNEGFLRTTKA
jgi:hypothetical protein